MTQKSIASKLSEIGRAVGFGVQKDGKNQAQNYGFVSAGNVRMEVGPELAKRKIAVSSTIEVLSESEPVSSKGNPQHRVMLRSTLTFVDGDTGETLSAQGIGCGMDNQDKAPMKAQTAAEKYAYVSAFTLAMGEDPEHDEPERQPGRMGDKLSSPGYAYGPEEAERSEKQAEAKLSAKSEADALISTFTCLAGADDASAWIRENAGAWDASDKSQRARIYRACLAHVKNGRVDGMTEAGFVEELQFETKKQRGEV